jgi:hypothetical protein
MNFQQLKCSISVALSHPFSKRLCSHCHFPHRNKSATCLHIITISFAVTLFFSRNSLLHFQDTISGCSLMQLKPEAHLNQVGPTVFLAARFSLGEPTEQFSAPVHIYTTPLSSYIRSKSLRQLSCFLYWLKSCYKGKSGKEEQVLHSDKARVGEWYCLMT